MQRIILTGGGVAVLVAAAAVATLAYRPGDPPQAAETAGRMETRPPAAVPPAQAPRETAPGDRQAVSDEVSADRNEPGKKSRQTPSLTGEALVASLRAQIRKYEENCEGNRPHDGPGLFLCTGKPSMEVSGGYVIWRTSGTCRDCFTGTSIIDLKTGETVCSAGYGIGPMFWKNPKYEHLPPICSRIRRW